MRKGLKDRGVRIIESEAPIIPIYTYELIPTLAITKKLYDAGVYVNASIPPATPPNECLIRTSLMATHTKEELEFAAHTLAEWCTEK